MVLLRVASFISLLLCAATAIDPELLECSDGELADTDACMKPVEDVIAYTPGVNYDVKIRCYDCPYTQRHWGHKEGKQSESLSGDVDMVRPAAQRGTP